MQIIDTLGEIYTRFVRAPLTEKLQNPRFVVNRSELSEISDRCVTTGEAEQLSLPRPLGAKPLPSEFEDLEEELEVPETLVYELSHTQLVGPELLAITRRNRYIVEETAAKPVMLTDAIARTLSGGTLPVRQGSTPKSERPIASLAGIQSHAYFHWFADYLTRVRGIEQYAEETGTYPDVLISANPPEWMRASLEYVDVPEDRIFEWKQNRLTASKLVIPTVPRRRDSSHLFYSPRELRWVGQRIQSSVGVDTASENRILITRRGASTRRIVNEEEVLNALRPLGFEPVNLSSLPLEEQVTLFSRADAVIAPHGAGLINMIYSKDAKILELFGEFVSPLYYCIAGGLGLPYRYERCKETHPTDDAPGVSSPGNDLVVDVDRLEQVVREWIFDTSQKN